MRAAAVFDVDRTLVDGMTGHLFSRHLWRSGLLDLSTRLRILKDLLLYRTGILPEETIVIMGVTVYAGHTEEALTRQARRCLSGEVAPRIIRQARERIARHRERGDLVLLASGSCEFIVEAIREHVGADRAVATRSARRDGVMLPEPLMPLCFGEGKEHLVRRALGEFDVDLADCTMYSDNLADLNLFESVARPVVVNPQNPLERIARDRGWEIEYWRDLEDPNRRFSGTSFPVR